MSCEWLILPPGIDFNHHHHLLESMLDYRNVFSLSCFSILSTENICIVSKILLKYYPSTLLSFYLEFNKSGLALIGSKIKTSQLTKL